MRFFSLLSISLSFVFCALGCAEKQCPETQHVFSMSCKVTSLNGELSDQASREQFADWCRANHISKLWLESYRHGESVPSGLLEEERDAFRQLGFEVCGMITPTCLDPVSEGQKAPIETCWSNPESCKKMSSEVIRAAKIFDTIILDDFLFTNHGDECPSCSALKAQSGIEDWEEFRRAMMLDVCRESILKPALEANPQVQLIIKFPCWWKNWEKGGYSPTAQAELFGKCWVGTETRDANPEPIQACWIVGHINGLTGGRCAGGWYDALDCTPEKFVEQAYYTILGGAKESLIHCYDYLLAKNPGLTPYGEKTDRAHACRELFEKKSGELNELAQMLSDAQPVSFEMGENGVSTHIFKKGRKTLKIRFNTTDEAVGKLGPHSISF